MVCQQIPDYLNRLEIDEYAAREDKHSRPETEPNKGHDKRLLTCSRSGSGEAVSKAKKSWAKKKIEISHERPSHLL